MKTFGEFINEAKEDVDQNTSLLIKAIEKNDIDEVKRLIPVSDPKANDSEALQLAALHGYAKIVMLLIPVSDPKASNSRALELAISKGYTNIAELLAPVCDPKIVKKLGFKKQKTSYLNS